MSNHEHHRIIIRKNDLDMEESHLELADIMVRSSHFPFEPFLEIIHVTLRFVVCLLEHF